MGYQKRRPITSREVGMLGLIGFVVIIFASILIGTNIALSRIMHEGGEFFVAREGARAFLFEHIDPYSGTVATMTQELVYGRTAIKGENPYFLNIPFFLLPFYFPIALISQNAVAHGIWMFLEEGALFGTSILCLQVIGWRPVRFFLIFYSLVSIFSFYSVASLMEGTPVIILGLLYVAILLTYLIGQYELTGMLLVLTLFNWEVGSLFLLFVAWKIYIDKRWRVFYGFGMTFIILFTLSVLIYPGWIYSFTIAVLATSRAQFGITSTAVLSRLFPAYGQILAQAVAFLGIIVLVYEGTATQRSDMRRFIWTSCLALAVTPLMGFRTEISNLVVLFPGLALIFAATIDRWRSGSWLTGFLLALFLIIPWSLFVRWYLLKDPRFSDYLFLFYPLLTITGLYWTRWWFISPPRTRLEQLRSPN